MSRPLVSAVCVTGKSPFHIERLLPAAAASFALQSYPVACRELVVVSDVVDNASREKIEQAVERGFQQVRRPARASFQFVNPGTLGYLRNAGLDTAYGDLIIQWDDDDWHGHDRIAAQVDEFCGLPVFLQRQLCWDLPTNTACIRELESTFIHGTILHGRSDARYPEMAKEEDSHFLANFPNRAILDNDPALYVRLSHGHNTWDRDHILRGYAGEWAMHRWHLCWFHGQLLRSIAPFYGVKLPEEKPDQEADRDGHPEEHAPALRFLMSEETIGVNTTCPTVLP